MHWKNNMKVEYLSLQQRIALAIEHAKSNGQMNDSLWGYQRFSVTIGELLIAAQQGLTK